MFKTENDQDFCYENALFVSVVLCFLWASVKRKARVQLRYRSATYIYN